MSYVVAAYGIVIGAVLLYAWSLARERRRLGGSEGRAQNPG